MNTTLHLFAAYLKMKFAGKNNNPDSDNPQAWLDLGTLYLNAGRAFTARAMLSKVIAREDAPAAIRARALHLRGMLHAQLRRYKEGLEDCTTALALDGCANDFRASLLMDRGTIYERIGDFPAAIKDCDAALEVPDITTLQRFNALHNRAVFHRANGDKECVLADYATILEIPNLPVENRAWTLSNRQAFHQEMGNNSAAIEDLAQIIELPDVPTEARMIAHLTRGVLYLHDGLARMALLDFSAVIGIPDAPVQTKGEALLLRSEAHRQLGMMEKSMTDQALVFEFSRAWRRIKFGAFALAILGVIAWANSDRIQDALTSTTTTTESAQDAAYKEATELMNSGKYTKAIAKFTAIIESSDTPTRQKVGALFSRAFLYAESSNPDNAINDFTAFLKYPTITLAARKEALALRGKLHRKVGNEAAAKADEDALRMLE